MGIGAAPEELFQQPQFVGLAECSKANYNSEVMRSRKEHLTWSETI